MYYYTIYARQISPSHSFASGPRFHEFVSSMSIEGYSFGVTFFDVVGSAGNTALYFMREEERAIPMGKFVGFPMGFPDVPRLIVLVSFKLEGVSTPKTVIL